MKFHFFFIEKQAHARRKIFSKWNLISTVNSIIPQEIFIGGDVPMIEMESNGSGGVLLLADTVNTVSVSVAAVKGRKMRFSFLRFYSTKRKQSYFNVDDRMSRD